jgi:RNA polymerase sigma factor (sigma-70 family)
MAELTAEPRSAAMSDATDFERIYRANVTAISGFFERRCAEPQEVADLTSETFEEAIRSFAGFDPRRGTVRAWLFGIARHRYARHCERCARAQALTERVRVVHPLAEDVREEIEARIDAQRAARVVLARCADMSELDRSVVELVDLSGLSSVEAATVLGVKPTTVRVRLFRARARLRKELNT